MTFAIGSEVIAKISNSRRRLRSGCYFFPFAESGDEVNGTFLNTSTPLAGKSNSSVLNRRTVAFLKKREIEILSHYPCRRAYRSYILVNELHCKHGAGLILFAQVVQNRFLFVRV